MVVNNLLQITAGSVMRIDETIRSELELSQHSERMVPITIIG